MKVNSKNWSNLENNNVCSLKIPLNINIEKSILLKAIQGHIPRDMDDRWFIYEENSKIYFHRSWTGKCVAIIDYDVREDDSKIIGISINPEASSTLKTDELINDILSVLNSYFYKAKS